MELCHAEIKRYVKKCCTNDRSMVMLHNDVLNGMYGGLTPYGIEHNGVDVELCKKYINHCQKYMNETINKFGLGDNNDNINIHNLWNINIKFKCGDIEYIEPISKSKWIQYNKCFEFVKCKYFDQNAVLSNITNNIHNKNI